MIDSGSMRTANVVSTVASTCMVLSRGDFDKLLTNIKNVFTEQSIAKGYAPVKGHHHHHHHGHHGHHHGHHQSGGGSHSDHSDHHHRSGLDGAANALFTRNSYKRRISGFDNLGHPCGLHKNNLLKRFSKFASEAMWNSLYSRMFRELKISPEKIEDCGKLAVKIMKENTQRNAAVQAIRDNIRRILTMDIARRSSTENAFIMGLMNQKNGLNDLFCSSWPTYQYAELCKKIRYLQVQPLRKVSAFLFGNLSLLCYSCFLSFFRSLSLVQKAQLLI